MGLRMVSQEIYLHAGAMSAAGLICSVPQPNTNALLIHISTFNDGVEPATLLQHAQLFMANG